MDTKQNIEKTEALIDALRATCANYGLSGDSSEYKIIVQVFLYKFLNDKFGYEIKKADTDYRQQLCVLTKCQTLCEYQTPSICPTIRVL